MKPQYNLNTGMKYPMDSKTERPLFEYMITTNIPTKYWLFKANEFDAAIAKLKEVSLLQGEDGIAKLFEVYFDTRTREYYGQNTFTAYDGELTYDKHAPRELHLHYYMNAGEWMNPTYRIQKELSDIGKVINHEEDTI